MQAWGAPQHEVDAVQARIALDAKQPIEEGFGVYAENWQAVMAFETLGARWLRAGFGGQRTGMDWAGVEAWIDRHIRRRDRRALSRDLTVMERAALEADRELQQNKPQGRE